MIKENIKTSYIRPSLELANGTVTLTPLCASGEVNPGMHVSNYTEGETF